MLTFQQDAKDGTPLTEDELNKLTDLAGDVLWEMAYDSLH